MRGLQNKAAIVAGGAPGNIGGATAIRLAQEGMKVVVADLNASAAQAVADEINSAGGYAVARGCDISNESSYQGLIEFTATELGGLDGLFNVAADLSSKTIDRDTDVLSVPNDVWQHTIDVTLTGYMYGIRHALPLLIARGGGSIVNTMSSEVWMGESQRVAYQTAKSGLISSHDPSRAPAGHAVFGALTFAPYNIDNRGGAHWDSLKETWPGWVLRDLQKWIT